MKLIFAIGNPGSLYKYTYHNLGILLSDYLIENKVVLDKKESSKYIFYKLQECNVLQSKVYMNNSFDALREVYKFFKLTPKDLLVLHDELGLKKFTFKLKQTEGIGGHNGLRDIANNIGKNFSKLQIGIDHPKNFNPNFDVSSYVLSNIDINEWCNFFDFGIVEIDRWLDLCN